MKRILLLAFLAFIVGFGLTWALLGPLPAPTEEPPPAEAPSTHES